MQWALVPASLCLAGGQQDHSASVLHVWTFFDFEWSSFVAGHEPKPTLLLSLTTVHNDIAKRCLSLKTGGNEENLCDGYLTVAATTALRQYAATQDRSWLSLGYAVLATASPENE